MLNGYNNKKIKCPKIIGIITKDLCTLKMMLFKTKYCHSIPGMPLP